MYTLKNMDIVVTATDAMKYLIKKDDVQKMLSGNKQKKMLFIDISAPRNIDPRIRQIGGKTLLDIDSLKIRNIDNKTKQKVELSLAEEIVQFHVNQYCERFHHQQNRHVANNETLPHKADH